MKKAFLAAFLFAASLSFSQIVFVDKKADGQDPGVENLRGAFAFGMSPDGRHLYAPGSLDHGLVVFSIHPFSGALSFVEAHVDGIGGITSLASCRAATVSADGKHVYTAALTDSAVTVFSRNETTGALTLVQAIFDLDTGGAFDGLGGAMSVVGSPDGSHVYVGARSDDAIVAFSRNAMTGVLTLVQVYKNLTPPIVGLDGLESIVISPDGDHLYGAAESDQALTAFSRDAMTGALTFINAYFDGVGGVDGLGCTNNLAISPEGDHVYAIGQFGAPSSPSCTVGFDDWLGIFSRDSVSGALTFITKMSPDDFNLPIGCGGVAGDNGVTVAPNGQTVYATHQYSAAVIVLTRNETTGLLTFLDFDCADLGDPDAHIDLLSAHRVITDNRGNRVMVSALSPGTALVYETQAYSDFRAAVAGWPTSGTVVFLVEQINTLPDPL